MKIIILGAGQVGSSLAAHLSTEANDITVIDHKEESLRALRDRLDISTECGQASHPVVLRRAGADDADMVIAVTDSDETNMVACQVAYTIFHTPTKIARVRSVDYLRNPKLFTQEALPVDVLISRLRQKLGDDPKNPHLFKTVWGRGYQFIGGDDAAE